MDKRKCGAPPESKLWCLHGNLQTQDVWRPFEEAFTLPGNATGQPARPLPLKTVDLWGESPTSLEAWAHAFCKRVMLDCQGFPQFLMGYSLGGRLALHAAIANPSLWRGIIVIAGHPGIENPAERHQRLETDKNWGRRFLTEPWGRLLADWNKQAVFLGGSKPVPPAEKAFDRGSISLWFDRCSTGRQNNLRPSLARLERPPILYLSGAGDRKYTGFGRDLASACPCLAHQIIPGAGHRVPWEISQAFVESVQSFINDKL